MPVCCVAGCGAIRGKSKGVSFFCVRRPDKNWTDQLVRLLSGMDKSFSPDNSLICSRHFDQDCFLKVKGDPLLARKQVKSGSIPTLFMSPRSSHTGKQSQNLPPAERVVPTVEENVPAPPSSKPPSEGTVSKMEDHKPEESTSGRSPRKYTPKGIDEKIYKDVDGLLWTTNCLVCDTPQSEFHRNFKSLPLFTSPEVRLRSSELMHCLQEFIGFPITGNTSWSKNVCRKCLIKLRRFMERRKEITKLLEKNTSMHVIQRDTIKKYKPPADLHLHSCLTRSTSGYQPIVIRKGKGYKKDMKTEKPFVLQVKGLLPIAPRPQMVMATRTLLLPPGLNGLAQSTNHANSTTRVTTDLQLNSVQECNPHALMESRINANSTTKVTLDEQFNSIQECKPLPLIESRIHANSTTQVTKNVQSNSVHECNSHAVIESRHCGNKPLENTLKRDSSGLTTDVCDDTKTKVPRINEGNICASSIWVRDTPSLHLSVECIKSEPTGENDDDEMDRIYGDREVENTVSCIQQGMSDKCLPSPANTEMVLPQSGIGIKKEPIDENYIDEIDRSYECSDPENTASSEKQSTSCKPSMPSSNNSTVVCQKSIPMTILTLPRDDKGQQVPLKKIKMRKRSRKVPAPKRRLVPIAPKPQETLNTEQESIGFTSTFSSLTNVE